MPASPVHARLLAWYADQARDLPWRRPDADGWSVLVSEVMLQQTPVVRVLPVYAAWMDRWPTPAALAMDSPGEAVRAWGRLGYPRRALRLHEAARVIDERHGGTVPATYERLHALPGVGDYTASAVLAFAFRRRTTVLDTNVRRVLTRLSAGRALPGRSVNAAERTTADALLPDDAESAARWSVALMELGALVCTARNPKCVDCPLTESCAWRSAGYPAHDGPPRRGQPYAGTDRQCRGRILSLLREAEAPVPITALPAAWTRPQQRQRALDSLIDDGLVVSSGEGALTLP